MSRRPLALVSLMVLTGIAGAQVFPLAPNVPREINVLPLFPFNIPFSMQPVAGNFNVVAARSNCNQTLSLAGASSSVFSSSTAFAVTFQSAAPSGSLFGATDLLSAFPLPPLATVTLEHVTGVPVSLNSFISTSVPAGHPLKVLSMATNFTGAHDLIVTGDPALRWRLFNAGTPGAWRSRDAAIASGNVGGPPVVLNLSPINYALVVTREGSQQPTSPAFSARLAPTTNHFTLPGPGTSVANLANASYQFTMTPPANRWTAVGISGSVANGFTVSMGSAVSGTASNGMAYVVANGRVGTVSPADGLLAHFSSLGLTGTLHQAAATAMAVGTPGSMSWTTSHLLHIFEFTVPAAAHYDVNVAGVTGLGWALFDPGFLPTWRPRTQNLAAAGVGTARNVFLSPGPHAIVVAKSTAGASSGTLTCSVTPGNPFPVVTTVAPASVPAGSPSGTVLVNGTGFTAATTAAWDGTVPLAVVGQTATQITVAIPASLVQSPGVHAITATNAAPGGGTSAPVAFAALAPTIAAVSPSAVAPIPPGGLPVTITVDGAEFLPGTVVHAGTVALPTTFVNATRLTAVVGPAVPDAAFAGGMAITAENGRLAQSNTVSVPVAPGGNNHGTIVRAPLDPLPNEHYVARLEGGVPGSLFSLLADLAYPAPVVHWPDATGDMVLRITSPAVLPLLDGFGLYGPPFPGAVYGFNPAGTAPGGVFTVPGFIWPAAPINFRLALQTVHLDPAAAYGFTLSWPRTEDL